MIMWIQMVKYFFGKHGFPRDKPIVEESDDESSVYLQALGSTLYRLSQTMLDISTRSAMYEHDHRALRAQLQLEETAEFILALAQKDDEQTLDAVVDMVYCAIGSSLTYGLPIDKGFERVHQSNMTKPKSHNPRLKEKPEGYVDPDLGDLL